MIINVFDNILNKKIVEVQGLYKDSKEVIFIFDDDSAFKLFHEQDCCEKVFLGDIVGVTDLKGAIILNFEEVTDTGAIDTDKTDNGTYTYTFYKLCTTKGYLDLKWEGYSNGYYSESIDTEYYNDRKKYNI